MNLLFASILSIILIVGMGSAYAEEVVYFDMNKNPEVVKKRVSDSFWENPMNTPPLLALFAIIPTIVLIAWKRKWHVHEKKSGMEFE